MAANLLYPKVVSYHNRYMDYRLGVYTLEEELQSSNTKSAEHFECLPTPYWVAQRILSRIVMGPNDVFVDFGAGTGRVICLAARMHFSRVYGVELNPRWAAQARSNATRLKKRRSEVVVAEQDAVEFDCIDGTIFYFFNPFGGGTLKRVIENIRLSIHERPRSIRIVALNPACFSQFEEQDWLDKKQVLLKRRNGEVSAVMYKNAK